MLWQLYFEYLTDVFYVTVKTSIVLLAFRVGDMLLPTFTHRILHQPLHFFIVRAGTNEAAAHQHCQMRKAATHSERKAGVGASQWFDRSGTVCVCSARSFP